MVINLRTTANHAYEAVLTRKKLEQRIGLKEVPDERCSKTAPIAGRQPGNAAVSVQQSPGATW
jgi:hypothetical protein